MPRLAVCCVLGLLLAMTSPGLTAPTTTTLASLDGVLSGIPGLPSFLSNMDAAQLVTKVAELSSQGRLAQYLQMAEMFLDLPLGQGSDLERVKAIIDAVVPEPKQAALLKAEVTSALTDGAPETSAAIGGGPLSVLTLPGSPGFSTGPQTPWVTPQLIGFPQGGIPGTGLTGSGFSGNGFAGSGFPGSGFPGSGFAGSGFAGSGFPGSGFAGSGFAGSGFPGSGLSGSALPGSGLPGSGLPGIGLPGSGLPGIGLPGAGFPGAGLPGAGLPGSSLGGSGFPGSGLGGRSPGQSGNGAGDFPWPFTSQWQPGAGLQWLFENLLGGGGMNQVGFGGQGLGGWGQGQQTGLGLQGREGRQFMNFLGGVAEKLLRTFL